MKGTAFNNGFDLLLEDLTFEQVAKENAIRNRSSDQFGVGGFILGGQPSVNGANAALVDLTRGVGYDSRGERFSFLAQSGIVVPSGTSYIVVAYQNTTNTPQADPIYGIILNTRTQESSVVSVLSSWTQGATDTNVNPYVIVCQVINTAGSLVINDLRVMLLDLKVNTVDTPQIAPMAVTPSTLAKCLRQSAWTDDPGLYYDKYSGQLKVTGVFSTNPNFYMPGNPSVNALDKTAFPLTCAAPSYIIATETVLGSRVWTASAVAITSGIFDMADLSKNQLFLGYINNNGIFENVQTAIPSEIVLASEDESQTGTPRTSLHKNLWRRTNELCRSYTALTNDGTPVSNPHRVTFNMSAFQIAPGVSYVAGRRFCTTSAIPISSVNTINYPPTIGSGNYGLWILRESVGGKQFELNNSTIENAYLIAYLNFDSESNPVEVTSIEQVFSPLEQLDETLLSNESVLVGAEVKYYSATQVSIGKGIIGFLDGQVRKNVESQLVDITSGPGYNKLDTNSGIETFSSYGLFAVADLEGVGFNVIASKMPVATGVSNISVGGAANKYTVPSASGLVGLSVGQKIKIVSQNYRLNQYFSTSSTFGADSTQWSSDDCYITNISVSALTITVAHADGTTGAGPSVNFSGGVLQVLSGFVPGSGMTPPLANYRFLGAVVTDASANILKFNKSGNVYEYETPQALFGFGSWNGTFNLMAGASNVGIGRAHDVSAFCPGVANLINIVGDGWMDGTNNDTNPNSPMPASSTASAIGNRWYTTVCIRSGMSGDTGSDWYQFMYMSIIARTGTKGDTGASGNRWIGISSGMIQSYFTANGVGVSTLNYPPSWTGGHPDYDYAYVVGSLKVGGFQIDPKTEWALQ